MSVSPAIENESQPSPPTLPNMNPHNEADALPNANVTEEKVGVFFGLSFTHGMHTFIFNP